jgi:hypothetical protein
MAHGSGQEEFLVLQVYDRKHLVGFEKIHLFCTRIWDLQLNYAGMRLMKVADVA